MEEKYLNLSAEDLLEDREFIRWVLYRENDISWSAFCLKHPDFKMKAEEAEKILSLLSDRKDEISETDIKTIWHNILRYETIIPGQVRVNFFRRALKYAAALLLLISIGITGYHVYRNRQVNNFKFASGVIPIRQGESKLILANGNEISLKKDNSSIIVKGNEEIIINNEQSVSISKQKVSGKEGSGMNEVVIPYGKKSLLNLGDGTKVWLDAGSKLAFPTTFSGTTREVYLEGDAYFEVAHNSDMPFIVRAGEINVKVLGTRFYLSAITSDAEIVTVLIEGSVEMKPKSSLRLSRDEVVMEAGQKATFDKGSKRIKVKKEEDVDYYIAWTEGWFQFKRESLNNVFSRLERYYNVDFIFNDTFPSDDLITGKLDLKDSIPEVLETLSALSGISYRVDHEKVYVTKKLNE